MIRLNPLVLARRSHARREMKYWEIIADNLSKAGGVGAASQRLIPTGERSGLQTYIATTGSVSLCVRMKSLRRFWNWKRGFVARARTHLLRNRA